MTDKKNTTQGEFLKSGAKASLAAIGGLTVITRPERVYSAHDHFEGYSHVKNVKIAGVSIAAPNYWHSLMTIWSCQAGKDVYVEKSCSHNLWEGQQLVKAAEKYGRMVQHGTQGRSAKAMLEAQRRLGDDEAN